MVSSSTSGAMYLSNQQHNMQQFRSDGWQNTADLCRRRKFLTTQTSWCRPSDWVQCQWCPRRSRDGRPIPGQRWRSCSSSSPGCFWTSGPCGRCLAFLERRHSHGQRAFYKLMSPSKSLARSFSLSKKNWFLRSELCNFPLPDYWSSVRLKKKIWKKRVGQQNYRPHDILFSINF